MSEAEKQGYVQVATDGSGKKVDNTAVTLPKGTRVLNADGTYTELSADTVVYRQRVVLADPEQASFAKVRGEEGDGRLEVDAKTLGDIHAELAQIREMLQMVVGT